MFDFPCHSAVPNYENRVLSSCELDLLRTHREGEVQIPALCFPVHLLLGTRSLMSVSAHFATFSCPTAESQQAVGWSRGISLLVGGHSS